MVRVRGRGRRDMVRARGRVRPDTVVARARVRRGAEMAAGTEGVTVVAMAGGTEVDMAVAVLRVGVRGARTDSGCMPTEGKNSGT